MLPVLVFCILAAATMGRKDLVAVGGRRSMAPQAAPLEDVPRETLEREVFSLPEREWTWNPTPSGRESMWNPTPSGFFFSVTILFLFVVYGFCVCLVCLFVFGLGLMTDDCF